MKSLPYGLIALATAAALAPLGARAYTYHKLYDFCSQQDLQQNCLDGASPLGRLVIDSAGDLYGVTQFGGAFREGIVFELVKNGGTYSFKDVYDFCAQANCADGKEPFGGLIMDADGNMYGTTSGGGAYEGGSVFELTHSKKGAWKFASLYSFCQAGALSCTDGLEPLSGLTYQGQETGLPYDGRAPLFGTTIAGGSRLSGAITGDGVVYRLAGNKHSKYSNVYTFCSQPNCSDGYRPEEQPIVDANGNIYGTTGYGGTGTVCTPSLHGCGIVYELSSSGTSYTESVLYAFCPNSGCADGALPSSAVTFTGNDLLGLTAEGGQCNTGLLFRLAQNNGAWQEAATSSFCTTSGTFPGGKVLLNGDLFGVARDGPGGFASAGGTVWTQSGEILQVLYTFCSQPNCADGSDPRDVITDGTGNLFGTTYFAGANGTGGTVFELSP